LLEHDDSLRNDGVVTTAHGTKWLHDVTSTGETKPQQ
jgi:hypothetical protein